MTSIEKKLNEFTECSICLKTFTDPRILPCVHTFCLHCLEQFVKTAGKKPGKKMPCPLCRSEFIIPDEGVRSLKKNFHIENMIDLKRSANMEIGTSSIDCDVCRMEVEGEDGQIAAATMRCLECQENLCDACSKVHKFQKLTRSHQVLKIESDAIEDSSRSFRVRFCQAHNNKILEYYCIQCNKIACSSCQVESHSTHSCKNMNTLADDFRRAIQTNLGKLTKFREEFHLKTNSLEQKKAEYLRNISETERLILERSEMLKDLINKHTKSLLEEVSSIKEKHLEYMDTDIENFATGEAVLQSYVTYCSVLISMGSASDICDSFVDIMNRSMKLEKQNETLHPLSPKTYEVSFKARDINEALDFSKDNSVGRIEVSRPIGMFENFAIVVGTEFKRSHNTTNEVLKINLDRPYEVHHLQQLPTSLKTRVPSAVYNNTIYVAGVGENENEVWKYDFSSGWSRCANLYQRRQGFCEAFVDSMMYICGGYDGAKKRVLDSVETYCAVTDKCRTVGKLVYPCESSGNCVSYKKSLYIFDGKGKYNKASKHVQVYNTENNTCSLLEQSMPSDSWLMRAAVWQDSVILLGKQTCFVYNFETEAWHEREQFKTRFYHFGMALCHDQIFVIGGGYPWSCRDDVICVSVTSIMENKPVEWKEHARMPKGITMDTCGVLKFSLC